MSQQNNNQEDNSQQNLTILKIHPQQWNIWKSRADTEIFFQYLKDKIKEEADYIANTIIEGTIVADKTNLDKIAMLGLAIRQILEIDSQVINEFYKSQDKSS